jgi:predicted secreted Zn-dependent protease
MKKANLFLAFILVALSITTAAGDDLPPWFEIQHAKVVTYNITGSTAEELRGEMNRKGPHGWHGYTEWNLSWNCREITVVCTVTLPYWGAGESTPDLLRKYRNYWNSLARHEQGHVDIVARMVEQCRERVRAMECFAANRAWADTLRNISRESAEYDKKTSHGKTQGAEF